MLALEFGNQRWNGHEGMGVRVDDDDDDANFVHDPNVHLGRVHSITADKAMLASSGKNELKHLLITTSLVAIFEVLEGDSCRMWQS